MGIASTGKGSGSAVVKEEAKNEIRRSASPPGGKKFPRKPAWLVKKGGARRVRRPSWPSTWWYRSRWTWSIESKCSRYIEMMTAFQICETRTCFKNVRTSQNDSKFNSYFRFILHFHLPSRQKLGVNPLRKASEDIFPWRPDGQTQGERPPNTEHDIPNDVPEICI